MFIKGLLLLETPNIFRPIQPPTCFFPSEIGEESVRLLLNLVGEPSSWKSELWLTLVLAGEPSSTPYHVFSQQNFGVKKPFVVDRKPLKEGCEVHGKQRDAIVVWDATEDVAGNSLFDLETWIPTGEFVV
ncbi:hypothetical protein L2E82_10311 [Cichorium intybus]|uniref:Uncharacterized protein n=1 Tax=Cichorium intybus TaxID=13427 RepID=A0ACB9GB88_CICIN|nr:hypothetical protein L2E82_10311 [Cichorium intybus]